MFASPRPVRPLADTANGGDGISDIEGKAARGSSERVRATSEFQLEAADAAMFDVRCSMFDVKPGVRDRRSEVRDQVLRYASRKSDRGIPDCEQIVRRVDAFKVEWFGIVSGVRPPSAFCRTIEICSRSRTISKPSACSARRTFAFGASIGNFIPL